MKEITLHDPDALVTGEWLERHLNNPDLRIFDCSTILSFETGDDRPYIAINCKDEHDEGHIPGADYFYLQADFSRQGSRLAMTLADPETVAAAFASSGIDDHTRVVLYSRRSVSWATRFWWMLRWLGFDNAAVLDGGYEVWLADGRPTTTEPSAYPPGSLTIKLRPELFVGKEQVLDAISNPSTCTINALGTDVHSGENPRYGRPGRVPGSVNVPQISLVDPTTQKFAAPEVISRRFVSVDADGATKHITYCGGGIFATVDAFWLYQLGHDGVSVYDNSMSEWGPDETLPIERD